MASPSLRLPPPRALAPGFPNDLLDPAAVGAALRAAGVTVDVAAVLARLRLLQELMVDLDAIRDGRSMTELAGRVGVSADTVQRLMSGRTWPALDIVASIGAALERPLAFSRDGYTLAAFDRRQVQVRQQQEAAARAVGDASFEALIKRLRDDPGLRRRVLDTLDFGQ
jgi:transcriptional regulator with XRE-family HTH domain